MSVFYISTCLFFIVVQVQLSPFSSVFRHKIILHVPIYKFLFHCCLLLDCGSEATDITKMCLFKKCSCILKLRDLCTTVLLELPRKDLPSLYLVSSSASRTSRGLLLNRRRLGFLFSSL